MKREGSQSGHVPAGKERMLRALSALLVAGIGAYALVERVRDDPSVDCGDSQLSQIERSPLQSYRAAGMTATASCTKAFRPKDHTFQGNVDIGDTISNPCYAENPNTITFLAGPDFTDQDPDNQRLEHYYVRVTGGGY